MDTKGIVNLNYIVSLVLMDLDDPTMTDYKKFLQYAILGFQELNLFVSQSVEVAYLTVNQNTKTVDLPDDYITYTKIGFNDNGTITTLGLNEDLMLARDTDSCGNQINDNNDPCIDPIDASEGSLSSAIYFYAPHYRNGQFVGELFSGTGGHNSDGYYRIDKKKRQIVFNSEMSATEIILEYKSSGVSGNGQTLVPREYVQVLRAYVHWQRREYNDKVSRFDKNALKQRYIDAFEEVKELETSFTIEEYLESTRGTYSQLPKR